MEVIQVDKWNSLIATGEGFLVWNSLPKRHHHPFPSRWTSTGTELADVNEHLGGVLVFWGFGSWVMRIFSISKWLMWEFGVASIMPVKESFVHFWLWERVHSVWRFPGLGNWKNQAGIYDISCMQSLKESCPDWEVYIILCEWQEHTHSCCTNIVSRLFGLRIPIGATNCFEVYQGYDLGRTSNGRVMLRFLVKKFGWDGFSWDGRKYMAPEDDVSWLCILFATAVK